MKHIYKTTNKNLRKAIFKAFDGHCFYSGKKLSEDAFEIDHVVPKSKGGEDSIYNYVLVSKDINHKKSDKQDEETVAKILYIVKIAYAPKVLKILYEPPAKVYEPTIQYFIDKGFSETDAIEIKEAYIDKEGCSLEEAWLWTEYGCLLSPASCIVNSIDDVGRLQCLKEALNNMVSEINEKLRL